MEPGPPSDSLLEYSKTGGPLLVFMLGISVVVLALALAKLWGVVRFRRNLGKVDVWVVEAARKGDLAAARHDCEKLPAPLHDVFASGLDRALGRVKGDPTMAMRREEKRAMGELRSLVWLLGSVGALMPFVGLFGTVIGVMASFHAIGSSATTGFDVVSSGISEALISTAAGLFVALEAAGLFNLLQNAITAQGRALGLLVDELLELVTVLRSGHDEQAAG